MLYFSLYKSTILAIVISIFSLYGCSFSKETSKSNNESTDLSKSTDVVQNSSLNVADENQLTCSIKNIRPILSSNDLLPNEYEITYTIKNTTNKSGRYLLLNQNVLDKNGKSITYIISESGSKHDILDLNLDLNIGREIEIKRLWKNQKKWSDVKLYSCSWWDENKISRKPQTNPEKSNLSVQNQSFNSVFEKIFPSLKKDTNFKIILPNFIPEQDSMPVYSIIEISQATKYKIMLAFHPSCNGGNACRLGTLSGEMISQKSEPLNGTPIELSDTRKGYFVASQCGANCSDSELAWEQDGIRYTFALKAGNLDTLIKMIDSSKIY